MGRKRRRNRSGAGGLSRRAALLLLGVGGATAAGVSGAFDAADAQRPFDLVVGNDDKALLRLLSTANGAPSNAALNTTVIDYVVEDDDVTKLVTVENRLGKNLEFTKLQANFKQRSSDITLTVNTNSLALNETATISGSFACPNLLVRAPVDLHIDAKTTDKSIDLTRTVRVTCLDNPAACGIPGPTGNETKKWVGNCEEAEEDNESNGDNGNGDDADNGNGDDADNGNGGKSCTTPSEIDGEYDVTVANGAEIDGEVDVTGTVTVKQGGVVHGSIRAGGSVTIGHGGEFGDSIKTGRSLTLAAGGRGNQGRSSAMIPRIEVCEDLIGNHGPFLDVMEDVIVGRDLRTNNGFKIGAGGDLMVRRDACVVHGVTIDDVEGDLVIGGNLTVQSGGTIRVRGNLIVGGNLTVSKGATFVVDGDRIVTGTIETAVSGVTCGGERGNGRKNDDDNNSRS